jgi:valyl-tRNA synthetase
MKKAFKPSEWEEKLYRFWEEKKYFTATVKSGKEPFSIILPPPNANADLHVGHAMYVYEDIMIRYNKLLGKEVLWLPGADHAGFETQYVFEKHLSKQGKSRFDYNREDLFKEIWEFVMKNRGTMEDQLRKLGFALDWEKKKFTMDEDVIEIVNQTFKQLFDDGLIYRGVRLVNYSPYDGTAFSDLEVDYKEQEDPIWYFKYPIKDSDEHIVVATTRPETMLGDTAVAVHPDDSRYKAFIGKKVVLPIVGREIPIIADEVVDKEFGSGAVKVTPAHDHIDWGIKERHDLETVQVVGFDNKMTDEAGQYKGLKVNEAREKIVERMKEDGLFVKEDSIVHRIPVSYKSGKVIQPLPKEQWFINVRPLADKAVEAVRKGDIKIYPERFTPILIDWLERFHDWNISRQIAWGIRIPAYQCDKSSEWFVDLEKPASCPKCGKCTPRQDEDTFDTWFSSAQWPFVTLKAQKNEELFDYFYPTTVMETGYEILPWWVARMIMVGMYVTGKVPFKNVYLHGMVRDSKGLKMSKSKGNVINPLKFVDQYGADALRAALVFQSAPGGDVNFSDEKAKGMRNYANKIWNIGRFIYLMKEEAGGDTSRITKKDEATLSELEKEFAMLKIKGMKDMEKFEFSRVFDDLYEFVWHRFADYFIEQLKAAARSGNIKVLEKLESVYAEILILLHPFMPFVTEAVWKEFYGEKESILDSTPSMSTANIKN